jgi:hypothetical protein
MSPQTRAEIEELIENLDADNFDGAHDTYIAWLQSELDKESAA